MGGAATVFVSGLSVMVLELVAGRLVAPYFGQSTCTWAALSGVTLAGVSTGNAIGGLLSAHVRRPALVAAAALAVGGVLCAVLPHLLPLLGEAVSSLESFEARTAAFVIAAWFLPMAALGCITPSIAAASVRAERNGRDLGVLYFASMVGSAAGSVLGGLFLPFAWPADTLYVFFGIVLAATAVAVAAMAMRAGGTAPVKEEHPSGTDMSSQTLDRSQRIFLAAVIFVVGWFGMGIELAGAKLVTPMLGGSHIVWSLMFITFIATMGVGGWIGGIIADLKPRIETAVCSLIALAAVSCATIWAETRLLPNALAEAGAVARLAGFTVVAFSPLGLTLGAASTILLKFATAAALRTGDRSVMGIMYATASAGSVCGTFVVGFALVGKMGSAGLCLLLSATLVVTALAVARKFRAWGLDNGIAFRSYVAVTVLATGIAYLCWCRMPQLPTEVSRDSGWKVLSSAESRYNVVTVSAIADDDNVRTIWLDRIPHTTVDVRRRGRLHTSYTRMIDEVVSGVLRGTESPSLFMIGGGGYALPRKWTVSGQKWRRLVVAEIDGTVTDSALRFLDAAPEETNGVWYAEGDGRRILDELLAQGESGRFDVVVGDTISDAAIPYHLATAELNARIKSLLKPDGTYVMHLLDSLDSPGLLSSVLKTLSATWSHVGAVAYQQLDDVRQSFVVVASDDPLKTDMQAHAASIAKRYTDSWPLAIGADKAGELVARDDAIVFTDRFAPVEKFVWDAVFKASDKQVERQANAAMRLLSEDKADEALVLIKSALSEKPEFPEAIGALRLLLDSCPANEEAFALLAQQARRRSAGFVAQSAYASVLAQRRDFADAERELRVLRDRFPQRADFAAGWAINAAKSGRRDEARTWLGKNRRLFGEREYTALCEQIDGEDE